MKRGFREKTNLRMVLAAVCAITLSVSAYNGDITAFPGCAPVQASHFKLTELFNLVTGPTWEPVKMAFDQDAQGNVNIYFIDLRDVARSTASVKYYDVLLGKVSLVGKIPVRGGSNDGLAGLALDPGFKTNRWLYVQYSATDAEVFRLSRFTLVDNQLDMNSETVICESKSKPSQYHTGGAMQFDDYGDLWWGVGDNMAGEEGPSNTMDFRGKLVRIRPLPVAEGTSDWGIGKTYTIPKGNFGEHFAAAYPERAAEFLDPGKVLPELFAIGLRNPYTLTLDPVRRWATWGDCGPDHSMVTEEDNLITKPINAGYPYWAGANLARPVNDYGSMDPNAPVNDNSKNTGLSLLPPAVPSLVPYQQDCAMTGPIYRYDPNNPSKVKMPPHFHRNWFTTEFNKDWIEVFDVAEDGQSLSSMGKLTDAGNIFADLKSSLYDPIDFQVGPDGAFYIINYSGWYNSNQHTGMVKIEYIGPECAVPQDWVVEKVGCTNPADPKYDPSATHCNEYECSCGATPVAEKSVKAAPSVRISAELVEINGRGRHTVTITDISGKEISRVSGENGAAYSIPGLLGAGGHHGILLISVSTASGMVSRKVSDM